MDKFTEKLPKYLEDALTESEVIELETHLVDCPICQAEFDALTRFDQLLAKAPMIAPSSNFVPAFEARLERRLNRRLTLTGLLVFGILLTAFIGVSAWNLFNSGALMGQWIGFSSLWNVSADILSGALAVGVTIGKIAAVIFEALAKLLRHPALWGYVSVSVGLVWLWVQLFRRVELTRQTVFVNGQ